MRSAARLTYEQVQAAYDAGDPAGLDPGLLPTLYAAFRALLAARARRGTLDLDLPERRVVLDGEGHVASIAPRPRLDSHRLIEEFMVLANVAAAEELERLGRACMYRVHAPPSDEKLDNLRSFLGSLDIRLAPGKQVTPRDLDGVLQRVAGTEHAPLVNEVMLRSQSQAAYSPDNIGHFGLALPRYAHFTSPIRRYADLLVHRALIAGLKLGLGALTEAEAAGDGGYGRAHLGHRAAGGVGRAGGDRPLPCCIHGRQNRRGVRSAHFRGDAVWPFRHTAWQRCNGFAPDVLPPRRFLAPRRGDAIPDWPAHPPHVPIDAGRDRPPGRSEPGDRRADLRARGWAWARAAQGRAWQTGRFAAAALICAALLLVPAHALAAFDKPLASRVFSAALAFAAPRTLDPTTPQMLALWGLHGITALDPRLTANLDHGRLQLLAAGRIVWDRPAPPEADASGWGAAAAELEWVAAGQSPTLRAAGTQHMVENFFDEMFNHLDPYSRYEPPAPAEAERTKLSVDAGAGLGLVVANHAVVVDDLVPDGPGQQAGVRVGDRLLAIDGHAVRGSQLDRARQRLTGPEGTEVDLRVRGLDGVVRDLTLTLADIPPETVFSERQGPLLVIRISTFTSNTAERLSEALEAGLSATPPPSAIAVDLRGNRGGPAAPGGHQRRPAGRPRHHRQHRRARARDDA